MLKPPPGTVSSPCPFARMSSAMDRLLHPTPWMPSSRLHRASSALASDPAGSRTAVPGAKSRSPELVDSAVPARNPPAPVPCVALLPLLRPLHPLLREREDQRRAFVDWSSASVASAPRPHAPGPPPLRQIRPSRSSASARQLPCVSLPALPLHRMGLALW
ncbi:hypothetical protein ACQJBY_017575 [Aegilops geniculata]